MVEGMAYYKTLMWEGASPDMGEIIYTLNTSIILLVKLGIIVLHWQSYSEASVLCKEAQGPAQRRVQSLCFLLYFLETR